MSVYSGRAAEGWGAAVEGVAEAAAAGAWYFSTSSLRILPSGPDPLTFDRGIPRSRAIFFAMGLAKIRSPLGSSAFVSCLAGSADFLDSGAGSDLGASGAFADCWSFSDAASDASASAPEMSSPSSPMMAMGEPTAMFFAPSLAYRGRGLTTWPTIDDTCHVQ